MHSILPDDDLWKRFEKKIQQGYDLLTPLEELKNVIGICKLKKKIKKELAFLNKASSC